MPVLTPEQEDLAVTQLINLLRGRNFAAVSVFNILRKLHIAMHAHINNLEP